MCRGTLEIEWLGGHAQRASPQEDSGLKAEGGVGIFATIAGALFGVAGLYRLFEPSRDGVDGGVLLIISAILISGAAISQALFAISRAIRNEHKTLKPARKVSRGVRLPVEPKKAAT